MKKFFLLTIAAAVPCLLAAADLVPVNGSFEMWKDNRPDGFSPNTVFKGWTMEKRSGGACAGETFLHVATPGAKTRFALMGIFVPAKAGDKVKLSVAVRGRGRVQFEIYCYSASGAWVGKNIASPVTEAEFCKWTNVSFETELPPLANQNGELGKIRAVLNVMPESEVDFDAFSGSVASASAAPAAAPLPPVKDASAEGELARRVQLPPRLYAVPGHELNIYFANLSCQPMPGEVEVFSKVGDHMAKRFRFVPKPEDAGVHPVRIEWVDGDGKVLASASTEIVVAPAKAEPRPLRLMIVGDSLTAGTVYPRRIVEALRADGFTVTTLGSHAGAGKPAGPDGVVHEGFGGWTFGTFLTRWTDRTDLWGKSPFLSGPGKLDMPAYFARRGGVPDVITVLLGVNDVAGATRATLADKLKEVEKNADTLLNALAEAAPKAKIGVGLVPPPAASQDAFACNYHARLNRAQYCRNIMALQRMMEAKYRHHPRFELVPVNVNLDCENNYPSREEAVNAQNPKKTAIQSNAVHPAPTGYRQIGDSFYFWIRNALK